MFELRPFNRRNNQIANNPWHEIDEFEKLSGISLAKNQKLAVLEAMQNKYKLF